MRVRESGSKEVGVRQLPRTMLYWRSSIRHPSYHAVTLKGHHPPGAHTDVWACDISHACVCESIRQAVWDFLSLHPDDPSTHFCLTLSLPSHLCKTQMWQHVSHIRENWYTRRGKSCHSGLSICLFSIGTRQSCWEKSTADQMSLLNTERWLYNEAALASYS